MSIPIRLFANDVIIIGSVRADWPAPINVTIGNPRADKLGRNGFECIGRRCYVLLLLLPILCRAASSAALSHTGGFRVGGGVHDSYTFQC